jgi:hypothetical protein
VLRSMSLTFKTTCPIFLILIGDFSSAINSSFAGSLIGSQKQAVSDAHLDSRLSITETVSRQNVQDSLT